MKSSSKYSHIIWDWNGTLFNDVDWCIKSINIMLAKRGLKTFSDIAEYHNSFCFPVIEYYRRAGFDLSKESYEDLSVEFIRLYHSEKNGGCSLYPDVNNVLAAVCKSEIKQIVLSASEINTLRTQIESFNITHYFCGILGLSDIYAKSKTEIGAEYIKKNDIKKALLIGDTEHDYETAAKLGADCVLVSGGHQGKEKLSLLGAPVIDGISLVLNYI